MARGQEADLLPAAEAAEDFVKKARGILVTETLTQRVFSAEPDNLPQYKTREIISELGYATLGADKPMWHELRKVVSRDGKRVTEVKKARAKLVLGLKTDDERLRMKMLNDFASHALGDVATDYGLSLLAFRESELALMRFETLDTERIGADTVTRIRFHKLAGEGMITIFEGRQAIRKPLQGILWLRQSDHELLRIRVVSEFQMGTLTIVDQGEIDYGRASFGVLVPLSVTHRRSVGGVARVENVFQYTNHQMFGASADIKFTGLAEKP